MMALSSIILETVFFVLKVFLLKIFKLYSNIFSRFDLLKPLFILRTTLLLMALLVIGYEFWVSLLYKSFYLLLFLLFLFLCYTNVSSFTKTLTFNNAEFLNFLLILIFLLKKLRILLKNVSLMLFLRFSFSENDIVQNAFCIRPW